MPARRRGTRGVRSTCPRQPACTLPSVGSSRIASAASWIARRAAEERREADCARAGAPRVRRVASATSIGRSGSRRGPARARAAPRLRLSCRWRRARAPRRPRSAPGCCPEQGRCRSGRRGRRAGRRAAARGRKRNASSSRIRDAEPLPGTSASRCSRISASWPLSDGMSTSSSVRAARRSASALTGGAYRGIILR